VDSPISSHKGSPHNVSPLIFLFQGMSASHLDLALINPMLALSKKVLGKLSGERFDLVLWCNRRQLWCGVSFYRSEQVIPRCYETIQSLCSGLANADSSTKRLRRKVFVREVSMNEDD
jgi:hypothetical protein